MNAQEREFEGLPPPLRHPLLFLGLAFVVGTWLGIHFPTAVVWGGAAVTLSFLAWCLLFFLAKQRQSMLVPSSLMLALVVGAAAFCSAVLSVADRTESVEFFREAVECREDAVIRGRVVTEPSVSLLEHGGARIRFDFDVREVPAEDGGIAVRGSRVRVDWYGPETLDSQHPPFRIPRAGEGWQLRGRLRDIETRGFMPLTTLQVRKRCTTSRRHHGYDASSFVRAFWKVRGEAAESLSEGMQHHRLSAAIVKAMTLGFRSDIPRDVMECFKLSGTVHVFAISGLHVAIVASILMVIVSALPIPTRYRVLLFGPLIVAYTIAAGAKPSAIRACVMSLFLFSGPLLGRKADPVSSLSAAAVFVLAFKPDQILDLGFIFSFLCAAGIIFLVPVLNCLLVRMELRLSTWMHRHETPSVADFLEAGGLPQVASTPRVSWRRWLFRIGGINIAVSLAAWIASTPVTAMFFGRITPISILCNLAIIPLAFCIVVTAAFSIIFGLISPWAASVFNSANVVLTQLLVLTAKGFSSLPLASFEVEPWGIGTVALWYVGVFLLYLVLRTRLSAD